MNRLLFTKDEKDEDDDFPIDVLTSAVTFVETEHGRLRRRQRGIDKKDLQAARKHGVKHGNHPTRDGDPTAKYTYKDIVYFVNERTGEEITSYAIPLKLDPIPITGKMQNEHDSAQKTIRKNLDYWTSNTVIVVDTSGSMKACDVWGSKTRLGAVWVSVCLDFLAHRLESGGAGPTDVVSVVTLGPSATVIIQEAPCTWVLFNEIVGIYNNDEVSPWGHGPFLPSIYKAESLLTRNSNASCAAALIFLSDGAPSDAALSRSYTRNEWKLEIADTVANLSKKFGRRLTFTAIGIGSDPKKFDTLEDMVEAAKDYGAVAELKLPSMNSSSLGDAFTSVATSITTTQSEMTDLTTLKQSKVREVQRESRKKASEQMRVVSADDFSIYSAAKVKRTVYKEWFEGRTTKRCYQEVPLQHPDAKYVAFSNGPFGEGAERFAYRFFELAADARTIIGPPMVAKVSRLVLGEDEGSVANERARKAFVRTFCSTQQLARRLATEFNEKMNLTLRIDRKTPQVTILDCSIYQLDDTNLGKLSVLVEEKLDHTKWHKWNSNNGYVEGMTKSIPIDIHEKMMKTSLNAALLDLEMIAEDSEEESDEESETLQKAEPICFSASEVAQAFSHFTYLATGRKRLVCDLQGVFDIETNVLRLSDPVIHYHNPCCSDRHGVHGRTDRGEKGVRAFFKTHREHHGHLCALMTRGFWRPALKYSRRNDNK